jgi:methionine sulfoxide reductase heme-binding subunit
MFDHYAHVGVGTLAGVDHRHGVQAGVVALWLAVILPFTFKLRERKWMSIRAWRAIHYLGYAMWAAILIHGIVEGTDSGAGWVLSVYAAASGLVAAAAWWRWVDKRKVNRGRRAASASASRAEAA